MILAGDVGGTKTVLAVLDPAQGMSIAREATLPSREIESLESAVEAFLLGAPRLKVDAACVGVAGSVVDGRFTAAFRDKGRLDSLLSTVPVRLALDPRAPLWGAARLAALMETT